MWTTSKNLVACLTCSLLFACGGDVSVFVHSGTRAHSGLTLTVQVDEGQEKGFIVTTGPEDKTISVSSGQRLRITLNNPATLTLAANGANIDLISSSSTIWEGVVSGPPRTVAVFQFVPLQFPEETTALMVNISF